jgi:hypothetical protein
LTKPPTRKIKHLAVFFILTFILISAPFLIEAKAETQIISMSPVEGAVGTTVQLTANLSTPDGPYTMKFDEIEVLTGNAIGNDVNVSFIVPHASAGAHNIQLTDTTTGESDVQTFTVLTSYSFAPIVPESPALLRENESVTISVNMTGGEPSYTYPNVKVQTPSQSLTYEASKSITTNETGDFFGSLKYPDDFPSGANTNFTGGYNVLFNETVVSQFFIGLTNASEYHRGDFVDVRAVDYYPPYDNGTLTVEFEGKPINITSWNATEGVINVTWLVPLNATVGDYNLTITPTPNSKENDHDTQILRVPGFQTEISTCDVAGTTVPGVFVNAHDESADAYYNATSDADGLAILMLEKGNHSCEAYFKDVRVGEENFTVTEADNMTFTCQLTAMNINVIDEQNISIPQISITASYNYTTNLGEPENRTDTDFGDTNVTGRVLLGSLFPNATYMLNASRYDEIFNEGNDTINGLPVTEYANVTIICPARRLQVNVTDARNEPVANVAVNAQELMGGLSYDENTDTTGIAVLNCTLGKYTVNIYDGEILLNTTTLDLLQNQNVSVICQLYGLDVSVEVIDYLGRPISNANVTLQREGLNVSPEQTQSNGTAKFNNIIGGSIQITVYLPGQTQPFMINNFYVDSSTTIQLKIDKYVTLAGFLVETSQLAILLIVVVTVIFVLLVEVYRSKRTKSQKSEN